MTVTADFSSQSWDAFEHWFSDRDMTNTALVRRAFRERQSIILYQAETVKPQSIFTVFQMFGCGICW